MKTTSEKIRTQLTEITEQLVTLIKKIPVVPRDKSSFGVVIAPNYYWGEISAEQKSKQMNLKSQYDKIIELLKIIFKDAPDSIKHDLVSADKSFREWLNLESNWSIRPEPIENENKLRNASLEFFPIINILEANKEEDLIIIPDTNSLLHSCDPADYKNAIGRERYILLLLPTVLNELDNLKNLHRNPDVRDKAKQVITRIKGWRNQGSLIEGVKTDKTGFIKTVANEPNMNVTLSWLDKNVPDDRIIASVIEIQSKYPSSVIILFTEDINLQNKSEAAMIQFMELLKD